MRTHVFCKYLIIEKHELKDGACGLRNPIARSPQVQLTLYITHAGLGSFFWLPNAFTMVTGHAFFCTWSGASVTPIKSRESRHTALGETSVLANRTLRSREAPAEAGPRGQACRGSRRKHATSKVPGWRRDTNYRSAFQASEHQGILWKKKKRRKKKMTPF